MGQHPTPSLDSPPSDQTLESGQLDSSESPPPTPPPNPITNRPVHRSQRRRGVTNTRPTPSRPFQSASVPSLPLTTRPIRYALAPTSCTTLVNRPVIATIGAYSHVDFRDVSSDLRILRRYFDTDDESQPMDWEVIDEVDEETELEIIRQEHLERQKEILPGFVDRFLNWKAPSGFSDICHVSNNIVAISSFCGPPNVILLLDFLHSNRIVGICTEESMGLVSELCPLTTISRSSNDMSFASVGLDGILRLWDLGSSTLFSSKGIQSHRFSKLSSICEIQSHASVAVGGSDTVAREIDLAKLRVNSRFNLSFGQGCNRIDSMDSNELTHTLLATVGNIGLMQWDIRNPETKNRLEHQFSAHCVRSAPDRHTICVQTEGSVIVIWDDRHSLRPRCTLAPQDGLGIGGWGCKMDRVGPDAFVCVDTISGVSLFSCEESLGGQMHSTRTTERGTCGVCSLGERVSGSEVLGFAEMETEEKLDFLLGFVEGFSKAMGVRISFVEWCDQSFELWCSRALLY